MSVSHNGVGQLFFEAQNFTCNGGPIFTDVLGATYDDNIALWGVGSTQTLTFTDLDPDKLYTFAGVATKSEIYFNGLSTVEIASADAYVDENVLSALVTGGAYAPAFDETDTTAAKTFLTYDDDDLVLWSGISPGADRTFSIVVTQVIFGHRGHSAAFDAIALGQSGSDAPEPATAGLLLVGAAAALKRRRS